MRYSIRTITPVSTIPLVIDVPAAKEHLGILDDTSRDDLIEAQIRAAQDFVERYTSHILTPRVMEMVTSAFPVLPELIDLPRDPVTGIVSLTYTDGDGAQVEMAPADYRWSEADPGVLLPAFRAAWPVAADERGSVRLRFNVGYDDGLAPPALVQAVKLMVGHLFVNRETVITGTIATQVPMGVADHCQPFRRMML